jgi:uncharacterized protein DUF1707
MSDEHLRISDAEREQAAAALAEHYVQGRLTAEEHSERLDQIWAARTRAEMAPVFRDLPGRFAPPPFPQPAPQPFGRPNPPGFTRYAAPARRKPMPAPLVVLLVVLVAVTVLTHLPIIVLGLLAWWFLASHQRRAVGRRRW